MTTPTTQQFHISKHLQNEKFILIAQRKKIPIKEMNGWANNRNTLTLTATDPKLQKHIENGGNYAIVTHNHLVIIACDTTEIEQTVQKNLPPTHTVRSPRHKTLHYYYHATLTKPIHCIPSPQGDPVADIKHNNAYVLAAGSQYENYGQYETIHDLPIATIQEQDIINTLKPYMKIPPQQTTNTPTNDHIDFPITHILPSGLNHIGDEYRGSHPIHGSTTKENFAINTKNNTWYCFRHNTGGGSLSLLAMLHGITTCEELQNGLKGTQFLAAKQKAIELGYIKNPPDIYTQLQNAINTNNNTKTTTITKQDNNQPQNTIGKIITALKTEFIFKTPEDTLELHYYTEGIYKPAERLIETLLETILQENLSTHQAREIINHLKRDTYITRDQINNYNGYIPFKNCLVNIENLQTKEHTPDHFYTYKLNIIYDPTATCPKFLDWLNNVQTLENIRILQEYTGYILRPEMSFQKALWLIGGGGNGKTRYSLTIKNLFENNISFVELSDLCGERNFIEYELYGKLVNIASEPNTKKELQSSQFKRLTGGDPIYAEVKNVQKRVIFVSYAKWIVIGNRYPKVNDDTDAFKRRVLIIKWDKQFKDGQNAVPDIEKQWTTCEWERSGIINWALEGLQRLYGQGYFSETLSQEQNMIEFNRASDSTTAWLQERVFYSKNRYVRKQDAFEDYKVYCENNGLKQVEVNRFYGKLRNAPGVVERHITVLKERVRVFYGVELRPFDSEVLEGDVCTTCTTCTTILPLEKSSLTFFSEEKGRSTRAGCAGQQVLESSVLVQDSKFSIFTSEEVEQINSSAAVQVRVKEGEEQKVFVESGDVQGCGSVFLPPFYKEVVTPSEVELGGYRQLVCAKCGVALMDWFTSLAEGVYVCRVCFENQRDEEYRVMESRV